MVGSEQFGFHQACFDSAYSTSRKLWTSRNFRYCLSDLRTETVEADFTGRGCLLSEVRFQVERSENSSVAESGAGPADFRPS